VTPDQRAQREPLPMLNAARSNFNDPSNDSAIQSVGHSTWPAPGSEDTELGVLMELEVRHGEASVYAGVQA